MRKPRQKVLKTTEVIDFGSVISLWFDKIGRNDEFGGVHSVRLIFVVSLFVSGCNKGKEDPGLRLQYEKQKIEIEHLTMEVEDAAAKVSELRTDDPGPDLKGLEEKKQALVDETGKLESEIESLERKKEEAIRELEDYRKKYPLTR